MTIKEFIISILRRMFSMNQEVRFKTKDFNYYNRAAGIIRQDDMFLIMRVDDAPYFHLPGGHIEIGESSLDAVTREIKEELNYRVKSAKLFCVQENFYTKNDLSHHGLEYYYLIDIEDEVETTDREVVENDRGTLKNLSIRWVSSDELSKIDLRPFTVKDMIIKNDLNNLVHIIKRD
jgi:8-oxo-dGTP pyrophosphatase MutT (NUDIX family)